MLFENDQRQAVAEPLDLGAFERELRRRRRAQAQSAWQQPGVTAYHLSASGFPEGTGANVNLPGARGQRRAPRHGGSGWAAARGGRYRSGGGGGERLIWCPG